MPFTQANRDLSIATELGTDVLVLAALTGTEELSTPFLFELGVLSEERTPPVASLLRRPVTATIRRRYSEGPTETRYVNGIVTRVVDAGFVTIGEDRMHRYRLQVRPKLWLLDRIRSCRIFQQMSTDQIVSKVFQEAGLTSVEMRLSRSYAPREFCVQYNESSLDFVMRLLAHDGIFFFFEHTEREHKLVLCDDSTRSSTVSGTSEISYRRAQGGAAFEGGDILHWEEAQEVRSDRFTIDDYDFQQPSKELRVTSRTSLNEYEVYEYPGLYRQPADGETIARVRREADACLGRLFSGSSQAPNIQSGYTFSVRDHAVSSFNRRYLVVSVSHEATETYGTDSPAAYSNTVSAMPADVPFRPARVTPRPTIPGPQTAVVVGESGEELTVDKFGRVHVQFHWDRDGQRNERSSCFVRVAQNWASRRWGVMFLPRVGQEVVVEFEDGDPDRPLITGAVYNGENLPPYDQPAHKTRSTLKTNSSKGGSGFNELRFEDKAGAEQIYIHAQKDFDTAVEKDSRSWIGKGLHLTVVENRRTDVGKEEAVKIGANHVVDIGGSSFVKTGTSSTTEAGTQVQIKSGTTIIVEAGTTLTLKAAGSFVQIDPSGVTIQGPLVRINSGGSAQSASGGSQTPTKPDAVKRDG